MRLLEVDSRGEFGLTTDLIKDIPAYAILSHTWGADDDEVTFDDLQSRSRRSKAGYAKIHFCVEQAKKDGLRYIWVDTCCINKANNAELSEALNSMFRWYRDAAKCYVYLSDVSAHKRNNNNQSRRLWDSAFRKSKWFTRGWTLQELLAPKSVAFFSREGKYLGNKTSLKLQIHEVTDIPIAALRGEPLNDFRIDERLRWAEKRETKREEDRAYCLLGIFNVFMPPIYGEGENAFIRLKDEINKASRGKLDLDKVPYAKGAMFNAYDPDHTTCHAATRVDLLRQIQGWAQQPHSKSIFWLNGMAGTGKSTISWTFAEWLTDQGRHGVIDLGASFFFKRGEGDRGSASRFFPTIIRELVLKAPGLDSLVADVITSDPSIFDKALGEQFDKLIYQPLQKVKATASGDLTLVVVVDALDECEKERDIKTIIDLWSRVPDITTVRVKLFLTSRPDLPIQLGFKNMSAAAHRDMILQDEVPQTTIQHDIFVFLKDKFEKIRTQYNLDPLLGKALGRNWPGDKTLHALVDMAVPLFVVAATVCRFVEDSNWNPGERLETILQFPGIGEMEQMEQTYLPVLTQMPVTTRNSRDTDRLYQEFRMIVGSIVTLAEPLSRKSLATLLSLPPEAIALRLRPLHSVLLVPADSEAPIRTLHLSFGEFLLSDKLRDRPFGIDGPAAHRLLLTKCLELLSRPNGLRENMCLLEYPGKPRKEVDRDTVDICLPKHVQYACCYWVHHLKHSQTCIWDQGEVHVFLRQHFLHWLEALSLLGKISDSIGFINSLMLLVAHERNIQLSSFLHDAWRFVLANRYVINIAPLQLYSAALIFAPQKSIIKTTFSQIPPWIRRPPKVATEWSAELLKLEGNYGVGHAVTFSADGSLLATALGDKTIRLWNPATGEEVQILKGHTDEVYAVAFSSNDSLLASASSDKTVRVWNPNTGEGIQRLSGHTHGVSGVAFSPDDSLLASASWDKTVRLWNTATGDEIQIFKGHTGEVYAVAFSSDDSFLASGSEDKTIRLWNLITGKEVQTLKGHTGFVSDVTFSSSGSLLASASRDDTVKLWNPATGEQVQTLKGHTAMVHTVAFSSDDSLLASASYDKTIRLWDLATGEEVQKLEGHTSEINSVAFSSVGSLLASASDDFTVRLWDPAHTAGAQSAGGRTCTGHTDSVNFLTFSFDGSLLASASYDTTVRLWNTVTGEEIQILAGHFDQFRAVAFSSDDSFLASASWDETVVLWSLFRGEEVHTFRGHTQVVEAVAFSSDSSLLASASWDKTVRLWNTATGDEIQILKGHTGEVYAVAFSSDDSFLASGSEDKTIRLWNLITGKEMQKLEGHNAAVRALAFSSDNSLLASASCDAVSLWNLATGEEVKKICRNQQLRELKFSENGQQLDTDIGALHLHIAEQNLETDYALGWHLHYDWIRHNRRNYLWLPEEYRPYSSACQGSLFAIGRASGQVTFLELYLPNPT